MGGSTGQQTATSTSEPWSFQQPYIKQGMREAKKLYNTPGPEFYPGNTVAKFAPEQEQSFQLGAQRALGGNATMKAAEGYTQDVLGGKYGGDPFADQVYANVAQRVMPSVNAQFSAGGRYGSNAHQGQLASQLTTAYAPYASQNYQAGLDRMGQAANAASMFAQEDFRNLSALEGIGKQRQDLAQSEINDAVQRYNYNTNLPAQKLRQLMEFTGGNYGNTQITSTPVYRPSMFSQIAGGGLGLLGLLG